MTMKFSIPNFDIGGLAGRFGRMFNLNDSRWGRGDDAKPEATGQSNPEPSPEPRDNPPHAEEKPRPSARPGAQSGPPDLDALWRDFNRKLGGLLGKKGGGQGGGNGSGGGGMPMPGMPIP